MRHGKLYIVLDPYVPPYPPRTVSHSVTPKSVVAKQATPCGGDAHGAAHLQCTNCHSFPYVEVLNEARSKKYGCCCL